MTVFNFATISADAALAIQQTDSLSFSGGPARLATVVFNPGAGEPETITVTVGGQAVTFGAALATLSLHGGATFGDGSALMVGTSGDDHVETLAMNSAMFGGAGADFLFALRGDNVLQGNQGDDTVVAGFGSDTLFGGQGNDIIAADSPDDDGFIPPGVDPHAPHHDFAQGNLGNDTVLGGIGSDILLGGKGDDRIEGREGDDLLSGDLGDDTLQGGAGADTFHAVANGSTDRILDFHVAEGDRVQVDPGTQFQVTQMGADTVIALAGGGQMVLVDVSMASLQGDWIFGA